MPFTMTITVASLPEEAGGNLRYAAHMAATALGEYGFEDAGVTITEEGARQYRVTDNVTGAAVSRLFPKYSYAVAVCRDMNTPSGRGAVRDLRPEREPGARRPGQRVIRPPASTTTKARTTA